MHPPPFVSTKRVNKIKSGTRGLNKSMTIYVVFHPYLIRVYILALYPCTCYAVRLPHWQVEDLEELVTQLRGNRQPAVSVHVHTDRHLYCSMFPAQSLICPHVAPRQPQKQLAPMQLCLQPGFDLMVVAVVSVALPLLDVVAMPVDLVVVNGADVLATDAGEADWPESHDADVPRHLLDLISPPGLRLRALVRYIGHKSIRRTI